METITMSKNDELIMKLLHYFVTEQNYSPIVLKGAQNEIWLENLESNYKIVRLVSNYIHNDEQMEMDLFRTEQIMNKIKKKTMSFNMNALSIFVNLGENVKVEEKLSNLSCINIKEIEDLNNYSFVIEEFPTITKNTDFKENGFELFMKLTSEIGKKNDVEAKKAENVFTKKTPIVTTLLVLANIIFYIYLVFFNKNVVDFLENISLVNWPIDIYKIFVCSFINVSILQFVFNMYALYVIGPQIENFYGKVKYLVLYFVIVLSGGLLNILFNSSILATSNCIPYGLIGALLYFGYHYRVYLDSVLKSQILPIIIINFVFGYILVGPAAFGQIFMLIAGFLFARAVGVKYHSTKSSIINGIIMSLILIIFLLSMVFM